MTREEILAVAKPILFNTEMVRALLDDRKHVTRRVADPCFKKAVNDFRARSKWLESGSDLPFLQWYILEKSPYRTGNLLYVRETWAPGRDVFDWKEQYVYRADYGGHVIPPWRPSIHMPKEAARIFLRVTDVRAEHLGDITEEQAIQEGFFSREDFLKSILKMYPQCTMGSWMRVIEFERIEIS